MTVPNVYDKPTNADIRRMYIALGSVLEVVQRRLPPDWAPAFYSQAQIEASYTARIKRTDGTPWGPNAVSTVIPTCAMLVDAIVQNVDAVRLLLMVRPDSTLAIESAVRSAVEAAAQARWLLDHQIGGRARVARLYVVRRSTALAARQTAAAMGHGQANPYREEARAFKAYYEGELGLRKTIGPNNEWGVELQFATGYTKRAAGFMKQIGQQPATGPYAFYSGAAHSELWRIQHNYLKVERPDGRTVFDRFTSMVGLNSAVSMCIDALVHPLALAFIYLGRNAAWKELSGLERPLRAAMTLA